MGAPVIEVNPVLQTSRRASAVCSRQVTKNRQRVEGRNRKWPPLPGRQVLGVYRGVACAVYISTAPDTGRSAIGKRCNPAPSTTWTAGGHSRLTMASGAPAASSSGKGCSGISRAPSEPILPNSRTVPPLQCPNELPSFLRVGVPSGRGGGSGGSITSSQRAGQVVPFR